MDKTDEFTMNVRLTLEQIKILRAAIDSATWKGDMIQKAYLLIRALDNSTRITTQTFDSTCDFKVCETPPPAADVCAVEGLTTRERD